ncbi:Uncharacterized protein PBTT_08857 [Plasmodiophora brassicae]
MTHGDLRQRICVQRHTTLRFAGIIVAFVVLAAVAIAVAVGRRAVDSGAVRGVVVFSSVDNVYLAKHFDGNGHLLLTCSAEQCTNGAVNSAAEVIGRAERATFLGHDAAYTRASDKAVWTARASGNPRKLFFIARSTSTPDDGDPERISFDVNTALGLAFFPGVTMERDADEPGTWSITYEPSHLPFGMSIDAVLSLVVRFDTSHKMSTMWWSASAPWQGDSITIGWNWAFQGVVREKATGTTVGRITRSYHYGPMKSYLCEEPKIKVISVEDGRRIAHLQRGHLFDGCTLFKKDDGLCRHKRYYDKSRTVLVSICRTTPDSDDAAGIVLKIEGLRSRGVNGGYAADIVNAKGDVVARFSRTEGTITKHGQGVTLPLLATIMKLASAENIVFA